MARNLAIKILRTTRNNLDTQATAENLQQGELYLITDENVVAVGLTASTYTSTLAKAIGTDIDTGTDDAKYVTPLAINESNVFRSEKASQISGLTEKTTPVDADNLMIDDSAASNAKRRVTWANVKATLKTYNEMPISRTLTDSADFAAGDIGKTVIMNKATDATLTIPKNLLSAGQTIGVFTVGAGEVTIAVATPDDQALNDANKTPGQDTMIAVYCIDDTTNDEVHKVIGGVE